MDFFVNKVDDFEPIKESSRINDSFILHSFGALVLPLNIDTQMANALNKLQGIIPTIVVNESTIYYLYNTMLCPDAMASLLLIINNNKLRMCLDIYNKQVDYIFFKRYDYHN